MLFANTFFGRLTALITTVYVVECSGFSEMRVQNYKFFVYSLQFTVYR